MSPRTSSSALRILPAVVPVMPNCRNTNQSAHLCPTLKTIHLKRILRSSLSFGSGETLGARGYGHHLSVWQSACEHLASIWEQQYRSKLLERTQCSIKIYTWSPLWYMYRLYHCTGLNIPNWYRFFPSFLQPSH